MEQWYLFLRSNFYQLDTSSQEFIYQKFREFIYQDIYFLFRNHNLAEDVVQESFLKVIDKAPKLKDTTNIKSWIKTVARNTAYDFFKKNKKYHHISDSKLVMVMEVASTVTDVADQVEEQIRDEMLHEALNQLNTKYRDVLFLYYIENKSHKEIAKELDISEQATAQLLVRARKKLVHYFSRKWVDDDE
ncbi:MAG: sigma-70 family RNA polymerase sigma factor [Paenibacillus dendritiformis]|uniref:RNA polymerase sigma factor n=1 Tax=uncultured Paenibacillus sp. TaxID=227322 RepID=UPI0025D5D096|nr:sigma-70 family RNA polymerase sigma factor [uncultured Paenibacillus sp.]MDU5145408.1 sigma-70 family RNA polymerase sigma factor [Paenibacillus dendritiformis]